MREESTLPCSNKPSNRVTCSRAELVSCEHLVQSRYLLINTGVTYASSMIVAKEDNEKNLQNQEPIHENNQNSQNNRAKSRPELASKIVLGMRMPSFRILNQSDARPWHLQELLKSDGRWRLLVFAGNIKATKQMDRVQRLASSLSQPSSFLHRYKPSGKRIDSLIEVLTIHSSPRTECTIFDLPDIFHPYDDGYGWDYWKVYVDDESYHEGHGHAYDNYGIDSEIGCVLIVRPDQYVSWIGSIDDISEMNRFFSGVLLDQEPRAIVAESL
jgi:phenol 2-monooxygenase